MKKSDKMHWFILRMPMSIDEPQKILRKASRLCAEAKAQYGNASPFPVLNSPDGSFRFFAPKIMVMADKKRGTMRSRTDRITNYNYVFIYEEEEKIYELKQKVLYSKIMFLPKQEDCKTAYPYLRDKDIDALKKLEAIFNKNIPLVLSEKRSTRLGDKVRILVEPYEGMEATVVTIPRSKNKEVVVALNDWGFVPLKNLREGEYEVLEFMDASKHVYEAFSDDGEQAFLYECLKRRIAEGNAYKQSRQEADRLILIIRTYRNLKVSTNILRCKKHILLLYAYYSLNLMDEVKARYLRLEEMLKKTKAEQTRMQLLLALYVTSHSADHHTALLNIVTRWQQKPLSNVKKHLVEHYQELAQLLA